MKINCPHCGVHGSVNDDLAGKKLRCPKCAKVFLITEDVAPAVENFPNQQETLNREVLEEQLTPPIIEEIEGEKETEKVEPSDSISDAVEVDGQELDVEEETAKEEDTEDGQTYVCSVCGQSFAPEHLVEIDFLAYCEQCRPDQDDEQALEDEEQETTVDDDEFLDFAEEENDGEDDELVASAEDLETCSGCGESLHPQFLESHGGKLYCALCAPEDGEVKEALDVTLSEDEKVADDEEEIQTEEMVYGAEEIDAAFPKECCSVCGESFHVDFLQEVDSKYYCGSCQPEVIETIAVAEDEDLDSVQDEQVDDNAEFSLEEEPSVAEESEIIKGGGSFTVGGVLKEAWQKTKGAKAAVWGGAIVTCLLFALLGGGVFFATQQLVMLDPMKTLAVNVGVQVVAAWLGMLLGSGLLLIGVSRALGQRVSWRLIFAAFSRRKVISMSVAAFLQIILICIGFLLLILPGIYLSLGYVLTMPLILEKGLGPWQALEASRKAIHKKWWSVFGLYLVMSLIYMVSAIPLGIGLIWTVPMFMVMVGVLYVRLFDSVDEAEEREEDGEEALEEIVEEIEAS